MVQTYFPFDSGAGANVTESQWSLMAQNFLNTGVIKGKLNELSVYADSTGMQVKVKSGQAWMQGHLFQSGAEETLSISNANATNPRIDRVIVRIDWIANTIQLAILAGTPAASPVAPALTQNNSRWEISLAQVYVGTNVSTIAAGNVTDERIYGNLGINGSDNGQSIISMECSFPSSQATYLQNTFSFPKAYISTPKILPGDVTQNIPYSDVMAYPFITNVTTTSFTVKLTTASFNGSTQNTFGAGTLKMNFLIFGK
jgi:hypothetical protein